MVYIEMLYANNMTGAQSNKFIRRLARRVVNSLGSIVESLYIQPNSIYYIHPQQLCATVRWATKKASFCFRPSDMILGHCKCPSSSKTL